jgi:hypothetical protein
MAAMTAVMMHHAQTLTVDLNVHVTMDSMVTVVFA